MNYTNAEVLDLLTNYRKNQQRIAALRFELEHPAHVTAEEMIETLSFNHNHQEGSSGGHVSNKTLSIALSYRDRMDEANMGILNEIASQLFELERKQERLNYYLNLLDELEAKVIRFTYMDGLNNSEIGEKLGVSTRTVSSRRTKGIQHLTELFEFTALLQG